MVTKKQKGQSFVEFSLILPLALILLLLFLDPAIALANNMIGSYVAFKAAREASIFIADGTDTCYQEATEAAFGSFSAPPLIMVDAANWSLEVDPCPDDPSWSPSSQTIVTATLKWDQDRIFAWNFYDQSIKVQDVFQ